MREPVRSFACPYCWQEIQISLSPDRGQQRYVQDCEVCCNPMEIVCEVRGPTVLAFEAFRIQ